LDAPLVCAPSWQTPWPRRNSLRTEHTGQGAASPPGVSTRSCPTYGRSQHHRVTVSPNPFRSEELATALRRLRPGKSPCLDSIFLEFIHHARSALTSWFCDFLTACMRQLKIPKIWKRALIVVIPKPEKPLGTQRATGPYLCCVPPLKSSIDSSSLVLNHSSTHCSHKSMQAFDTGGRP